MQNQTMRSFERNLTKGLFTLFISWDIFMYRLQNLPERCMNDKQTALHCKVLGWDVVSVPCSLTTRVCNPIVTGQDMFCPFNLHINTVNRRATMTERYLEKEMTLHHLSATFLFGCTEYSHRSHLVSNVFDIQNFTYCRIN